MTTQSALNEVQAAIYATLVPAGTLDATLSGLGITGVFDVRGVPQGQAFDYIVIGDTREQPFNTLGRRGYVSLCNIHIFSRAPGTKTPFSVLTRINTLLDQQPLTLATQTHVGTMYQGNQPPFTDADDLTTHLVASYQITTQE